MARIYLRVSTDEQNLIRQTAVVENTRAAGFYVADIYREKASGAHAPTGLSCRAESAVHFIKLSDPFRS